MPSAVSPPPLPLEEPVFRNILIVDDSLSARMIIKQYLEIVGCTEATFQEAGDGSKALEILKTTRVDLIVTDMNMPIMDGSQFIGRLKASPKLNRIPIIIVSSAANLDNQERFLEIGANYVIKKPVSPQLLHEAISNLQ